MFIAKDAEFEAVSSKVKELPILVVAESPSLAKRGAAINLVFQQDVNEVRLEINRKAATNAGLILDPALLNSPLVDIVDE